MLRYLCMLTLMGGLWAMTGCEGFPRSYISDDGQILPEMMGKPLTPSDTPALADVPLPQGFVVVATRTRTYVSDGARTTDQVYQGRAALADTVSFYRAHLQLRGWVAQGQVDEPKSVLIQQTRAGQTLLLRFTMIENVTTVFVRLQDRILPALSPGRPYPAIP